MEVEEGLTPGFNLGNLLAALSTALDFTYHGLAGHHRRVAHVALEIGRGLGLAATDLRQLYCAALLHDIGAITLREKADLAAFEVENAFEHCIRGRDFVSDSAVFAVLGDVIATHHDRWSGTNPSGLAREAIPLAGRILHLADRVDVGLEGRAGDILSRREPLLGRLRELAGRIFDPELVAVLEDVSVRESFWFDLDADFLPELLETRAGDLLNVTIGPEELLGIARMFSRVIDSRSTFTYRHSALVARTAVQLASRLGFSEAEKRRMRVAALLHDLGKLSVPEEILEKPGKLDSAEYNVVKRHTYYTYHILRPIEGFETIREWAAYHHERLDGRGYPFGIAASGLSPGARVMAAADIFAALIEDRPYRAGMQREQVTGIIQQQVRAGALDGDVAGLLLRDYADFAALKDAAPEFSTRK